MANLYEMEDRDLLAEIRQGTKSAFDALYHKYWAEVYRSARRRLRDPGLAQDITQDIFVSLWLHRTDLKIDHFPAYFHVAVRNRVLNLFEKQRRYVPFDELLAGQTAAGPDEPDGIAVAKEFLQAYRDLVESLPEQRRRIFRSYYDEGLSTEEISRRLQLSRKTVQNQLGRAVSSLKAGLSHLFLLAVLFLF